MSLLINNILEGSLLTQLQTAINAQGSFGLTYYVSDTATVRVPMPYILIRAEQAEEQIVPGSGIFKCPVTIQLYSHVKNDTNGLTQAQRDTVTQAIQGFAYTSAESKLALSNLTVYRVIPVEEQMTADTELKAFIYSTTWEIYCTPVSATVAPTFPYAVLFGL